MKHLFILTLLILLFVSCKDNSKMTNQTDQNSTEITSETLPTFQVYGELAPVDYLDSNNPITEKYGFRIERITGCEVGSNEAEEANENNAEALEKMNEKYGDDWQANFEKETGFKLSIPMD